MTVTELDDGAQPEADGYADLTGHHVSRAAVHMDRMQQSLDDIALSLREFRGQHRQTEHTGET